MRQFSSLSDNARGFASEYGVDVDSDIQHTGTFAPVLAQLDGIGRPAVHITDATGTDYYLSRIDYYSNSVEIHACRMIAIVMPGYRTKLAYWTKSAAKKELTVHRGAGYLIIGDPEDDDTDDMNGTFNTTMFPLDPEVTPRVMIPPGKFYTIEAAAWSSEPLVISGLSKTDVEGNWQNAEITIEPGEEVIVTPDGLVSVPDEFLSGRFD